MKHIAFAGLGALALAACSSDETLAAYGASDRDWQLESIDGAAFSERATIRFEDGGRVSGAAPCNRWFGTQTAPYPWFALEAIGASRMACPDLEAESAFFNALRAMTLSEVSGDVLLLSNDEGREMVFRAGAVSE